MLLSVLRNQKLHGINHTWASSSLLTSEVCLLPLLLLSFSNESLCLLIYIKNIPCQAASGTEHGDADHKWTFGREKIHFTLPLLRFFMEDWSSLGVVGSRGFLFVSGTSWQSNFNCLQGFIVTSEVLHIKVSVAWGVTLLLHTSEDFGAKCSSS